MKTIWKQVTSPDGQGYILYNTETNHAVITENCPKKIRIYQEANLKSKFNCYKTDEISEEKPQEDRIVANFYINDIVFKTQILNILDNIAKIEIDGVEMDPVTEYQFNEVGNHIIKYKLQDISKINNYTFYNCSGLTSVTIPNSVTSIGSYAFSYCSGLTSITIPNSVTSIGDDAFYYCSDLTSLTIGNSVTSIGVEAFKNCSALTSITIPNSVTSIGQSAFYGCKGLTSISIGNSVTSIGSSAFGGCSSLIEINVDENNTAYSSIDGVLFNKSQTELILYPRRKQGTYTIPNSVTSIGDWAFRECTGLTSVTIPNSVTSIGSSAFSYCSGLTSIAIGNSVTSIGFDAFFRCTGLTNIVIEAITPPVLGNRAFNNTNNCPIYVPSESVDAYKSASGWSTYASRIQAIQE